ncbi:19617_t:CDS:2, partial [Cetraspora pellucida]
KQQKSILLKKLNDVLAVPETKLSEIKISEQITEKGCSSRLSNYQLHSTVYNDNKRLKILLNPRISTDDVDQIYNPKSNSNCGFHALAIAITENEKNCYLVKLAINNQLNKHMKIYKDWLGYNINLLKQILEFQELPYPSLLWFLSPDCAQLATNTFSVSIAIFNEKDEQCTMFFLLESVPIHGRNPIILHFINGNHIVYVNMKNYAKVN